MGFFTIISLVVGLFVGFNFIIFFTTKILPFIAACVIIIGEEVFKVLKVVGISTLENLDKPFKEGRLK